MTPEGIQAEIDGKHRLLAGAQIYRKMWLLLAGTHIFAIWYPLAAAVFAGVALSTALLSYLGALSLADEISALAKRRAALEEQVDAFVQERSEAIFGRMQSTLEAAAQSARADYMRKKMKFTLDAERDRQQRARADALMGGEKRERFMGSVIDITPEKS